MSAENTQVIEEDTEASGSEGTSAGTGTGSASRLPKKRGKGKRTISDVIVHVYASFNNTLITVTDVKGNTLSWVRALLLRVRLRLA